MKWTWIWLVLLAVCLTIPIDKGTPPNQQLTLQLKTNLENSNNSQDAISYIQSQLQKAGIQHLQIEDLGAGKYSIQYFSSLHVSAIEALFGISSESDSDFPIEISKDKDVAALFEVDIVEIGTASHDSNGFAGILVENQQSAERAYHPFVSFGVLYQGFDTELHFHSLNQNWVAITLFKKTRTNYEIPEVRAGPLA